MANPSILPIVSVLAAVITGLLFGGAAIAEDRAQHIFLHLRGVGPTNETDYVNGSCDQKGSTLKCHLTSSFVLNPKGEAEIQADIDKQLPYWTQELKSESRQPISQPIHAAGQTTARASGRDHKSYVRRSFGEQHQSYDAGKDRGR